MKLNVTCIFIIIRTIKIDKMLKLSCTISFVIAFSISINSQIKVINECDLEFNLAISKQDSIPLMNIDEKIIKYLTQAEYKIIEPYITISQSSNNSVKIKSIDQVIINNGDNFFNKSQLDSLTKKYADFWINYKYLNTDFNESVFMSKKLIPNKKPLHIYSRPSTESEKTRINPRDWLFENDKSIEDLYKINILGAKQRWIKLKITVKQNNKNTDYVGWMPWYNFCHNVLTTCSRYLEDIKIKNAE
ncbi:MAG TPA: hypothetical protein DDZ39_03230 [Flavobacteriaceae bacterium]|nr:hypothetical protein [Flavobacteriaceae bacterium]